MDLFGIHGKESRTTLYFSLRMEPRVIGDHHAGSDRITIRTLFRITYQSQFNPMRIALLKVVTQRSGRVVKVVHHNIQIAVVVEVKVDGAAGIADEIGAAAG